MTMGERICRCAKRVAMQRISWIDQRHMVLAVPGACLVMRQTHFVLGGLKAISDSPAVPPTATSASIDVPAGCLNRPSHHGYGTADQQAACPQTFCA